MRVEVVLRKDEDPHVYDADTKQEISASVQNLMLLPLRRGHVTLTMLKRNDAGAFYIEGGEVASETVEAELVYLRGDWESAATS